MNKACPVVLRNSSKGPELLVFRHSEAGVQVVKGTIEKGEALEAACEREFFEESGIRARAGKYLGRWEASYKHQVWGFCLMDTPTDLPDSWVHYTEDDGGQEFSFFWVNLNIEPDDSFHPLFQEAIRFIRTLIYPIPFHSRLHISIPLVTLIYLPPTSF